MQRLPPFWRFSRRGFGGSLGAGGVLGRSCCWKSWNQWIVNVVDRTGLTGRFSFTLTFDRSVSIFTTLQEQLGLKLEPATVASDIIVIDHVEPLIEN